MSRVALAGRTAHEWVDGIVSVLTSGFCPEHLQTVIVESLSVGLGDDHNGPLTTRSVDQHQAKRQLATDPNDDNVSDVSGSNAMESSGNGGGNSASKTDHPPDPMAVRALRSFATLGATAPSGAWVAGDSPAMAAPRLAKVRTSVSREPDGPT